MTDDIGKDLEALRPLPTRLAELTSDLRKLATCGKPTCLERRALSMLEELGLELDAQVRENHTLRDVVRTIHIYSRRYCDGRSTYAPDDHNRATHVLLALGVELDSDPISTIGPFASDGMYGLEQREHDALTKRQPWPDADPVSTLRKLHALAVEASRTDSTSSATRAARNELLEVALGFRSVAQ